MFRTAEFDLTLASHARRTSAINLQAWQSPAPARGGRRRAGTILALVRRNGRPDHAIGRPAEMLAS